ncbi:MAG: cation:proton antiporter [Clostridia bacterium]|nr:cation:proton antiporter [Clostridia bacterium]
MLLSLALLFLYGLVFGWICKKIHLPPLIGMLGAGILLGPYALNLIDESILTNSSSIRRIALVIILIRAGLSLNLADFKKVGRPAVLLCFVPACFEIAGMALLARPLLNLTLPESLLLGAVIGAVSPAVIVPRMIKLIDRGYGTKKSIPQMILAGASLDDVFVIVLFSVFASFAETNVFSPVLLIKIPVSLVTGTLIGIALGFAFGFLFRKCRMPSVTKTLVLLSVSFLLLALEDADFFPFSGLVSVVLMHIFLKRKTPEVQAELSPKFKALWQGAEILLFSLVGACVNPAYAVQAGGKALLLLLFVLLCRMLGVFVCLVKTNLNGRERLFCMLAYLPKATVQAAIGGIPLAMGLACGETILTVAVLSILVTAPVGAFLIDLTYPKLLDAKKTVVL